MQYSVLQNDIQTFEFINSVRKKHCLYPANVLMKTSSRRLDEGEYILINHTSSEDVFKTSWSRPIYSPCPYIFKTSSRRFQDVLPKCLQDVFKTSSRRLQNVFRTCRKYVLKTFSRRFEDVSSK